jgi:Fis family transcriptional regulator, factor for inversion stimulation protein
MRARESRARLPTPSKTVTRSTAFQHLSSARGSFFVNAAARHDTSRGNPKSPLRDHVAQSVRRYLRDLDGSDADDVYEIVLREMEIPLFVEVLNHCEGNQSRAAALLGIHRATLRKKLKDYGLV